MKYIAIFGDTHGHLRLMFELCCKWQQQHKTHLNAILQCGDMGFFPDGTKLDKATKQYAKRDKEELGFSRYFKYPHPLYPNEHLNKIFNGNRNDLATINCDMYWCHGNHEDFEELDKILLARPFSVDVFERLYYLPSGESFKICNLNIAAIGGAPERDNNENAFIKKWKYVNKTYCQRLKKQSIDVLITHCSPQHEQGFGSELLQDLIRTTQPKYNFFGHHNETIAPFSIGNTQCYWLDDVNFTNRGTLLPGCMGILQILDDGEMNFQIVEEEWLQKVNYKNWSQT